MIMLLHGRRRLGSSDPLGSDSSVESRNKAHAIVAIVRVLLPLHFAHGTPGQEGLEARAFLDIPLRCFTHAAGCLDTAVAPEGSPPA